MAGLALDKCSLISVFVESVLWGTFLSLYLITLYLLLQKRSNLVKHAPHLALVTLMFLLSTMHIGLTFTRVVNAFFRSAFPAAYLQDITTTLFRVQYGVHMVQIFMLDLLIVFRSYMLWNKNYFVVLLPTCLVVATMVAGGGALQAMAFSSHTVTIFDKELKAWVVASLALALVTKGICLFLVTFRVRQIHASLTSHVNRHITVYTLIVVLVESGAVALLVSAVLLPMFVAQKNVQYVVWDALSPIISITFTTIIAGMTLNLANQSTVGVTSRPTWNRYSIPARSPITSRPSKGGWNDSQDDVDTPTAPSSPVVSRPPSMHNLNQSTGTLNMGIVI